jgi:hypothetical protein
MIVYNTESEYEQARRKEIDNIIKNKTKSYGRDYYKDSVYAKPNKLVERPSLLKSYLESMPNCIYGSFIRFNLHQLEQIVEVRFVAKGAGYVEFFFKWGIDITAELEGCHIEPTSAGKIKIVTPDRWVDQY